MALGVTTDSEIQQGKALVDESVKHNVTHSAYSGVERGGDEASWSNTTPASHFQTKYHIEHHLRNHAGSMGWTILRPVGFMNNLALEFPHKVFLTACAIRSTRRRRNTSRRPTLVSSLRVRSLTQSSGITTCSG